ncbi:MAG: hypothetical protein EHM56_08690 [Chloroflexi bacterium]|nr:MAG: hypothetical protein EHM56_08690 [Chloroflexota bacterium]
MGKEKRHAAWWQLWLLLGGLGGLAFAEVRIPLSVTGHRIVEVGIVLAVYGLLYVWVRANEVAWLRETQDQVTWRRVPTLRPGHPTVIAGKNGDQPGESEWGALTQQVQPGALPSDRGLAGPDA